MNARSSRRAAVLALLTLALLAGTVLETQGGPIGYWRFEGTAGSTVGTVPNALSPGFLDGTGENAAVYSALVPNAYVYDPLSGSTTANATSLTMTGSQRVRVLDNVALDSADFTIEAFVRLGADQGSYPAYLSHRGGSPTTGWQVDINPSEQGRTRFDTDPATGGATNQVAGGGSGQALGVGQWRHTAVTFNSTSKLIEYFVDYGNRATRTLTGNASEATAVAADLLMGGIGIAGSTLDEVRFSNSVLSSGQFLRALGGRQDTIDTSLSGLSAHIVRVDNNLDNMGQVATALGLRPGDRNHSVSQVLAVAQAHIDTAGSYGSPVGVLAGDQHSSGANPEDYAIRLAGYLYAPTAGYTRTFAAVADDEYDVRIGGASLLTGTGVGTPPKVVAISFADAGYWPIEVLYRNRGGAAGLEISSREGAWTSADWNTTDFKILGSEPAFPVYQNPGAVPSPSVVGANSAGTALYAGPVNPSLSDGLRVEVNTKGSSFADVRDAARYLRANPPGSTVAFSSRIDYRDPQNGSDGSFTGTLPWPHNTSGDDDYFATRVNGLVYIDTPGDYAFAVGSDDGFRLRVGQWKNVIAEYTGGRGHPSGTANVGYAHFDQAGLYPIELYQFEGTGGSSLELSMRPSPGLLVSSRDPKTGGFQVDLTGKVFRAEPVARLRWAPDGHLYGTAGTLVPALGLLVPPEAWQLQEIVAGAGPRQAGLLGQYYKYSGSTPVWDDTLTPLGTRIDLQTGSFNLGDNYAYNNDPGGWGNLEDQFGVRWTGYLNVPVTGLYSLHQASDDRSWVYVDVDNDGVLDAAPGNNNWDVYWYDVLLTEGLHKVEFRAREFGGGESARLEWLMPYASGWQNVPADYFALDIFDDAIITRAWGTGMIDLMDFGEVDSALLQRLVLETDVAGLRGSLEGRLIPEPTSVTLLALGALGLLARRRKRS